jgi:Tfp pilus assembly protein PilN
VSQQINLFNPIFLKQKKYFSAVTMVQGLGLILVGCLLLTAYAEFQLSIRKRDAEASTALLQKTKAQLITIKVEFAPRQSDPALDNQIKQAQSEINAAQKVFDSLQNGQFGDTKGYSTYFRGFSHEIVDGLWLTGISIYGAGHDINLSGRTVNPELVPVFLAHLKREQEMQGKSFSTLEMQLTKPDPQPGADPVAPKPILRAPYIEFSLQSTAGDPDAANQPGAAHK